MSPKCKCHQNTNVTETKISTKHKCHPNTNDTKLKYRKNRNLPNGSGTTRSPGLVHINQNGLPGHGLCDSRLVSSFSTNIQTLHPSCRGQTWNLAKKCQIELQVVYLTKIYSVSYGFFLSIKRCNTMDHLNYRLYG